MVRLRIQSNLAVASLLLFSSACVSHDAFLKEMITPGETWATSQFLGDFDEDYRVDPFAILETFASYAASAGVDPLAAIILSGGGYQVITILREGDGVRANSLVMGHTRLACKYSGVFPDDKEARNLFAFLDATPLLKDYENTAEQTALDRLKSEFHARSFRDGILYVAFPSGSRRIRHGFRQMHAPSAEYRELFDRIDAFRASLVRTYPEM